MKLEFRNLRADEIECRVQSVNPNGLVLLLYKDARVDQNILDETVGALNWQRQHTRDNANCIVSIWDEDKKQWISKEDTGKESNTEAQKGLASDSFKRACFNWGIGRELYTAPFTWISADNCKITKDKKGKDACYDKFSVASIEIEDGKITKLQIRNDSSGKICFKHGYSRAASTPRTPVIQLATTEEKKKFMELCGVANINYSDVLAQVGFKTGTKLTAKQLGEAMRIVNSELDKR